MKYNFKQSAFLFRAAERFNISKRTIYRWIKTIPIEQIQEEYKMLNGTKLLTFVEVAKLFNCSKSSIYRWALDEGKLPYVRICGRALRIKEEDVIKAVEEFKIET